MTTGAPGPDYYPRQGMAPAFGDVGWRLQVGQIGVAPFDPDKSPFGWHIIKRVE
ncbi:MAG: peptidylprolyl isomerase [Gemmatimonadales bacterium]